MVCNSNTERLFFKLDPLIIFKSWFLNRVQQRVYLYGINIFKVYVIINVSVISFVKKLNIIKYSFLNKKLY